MITECTDAIDFDQVAETYTHIHDQVLRLAGGDSDYFYHYRMKLIAQRLERRPQCILDFGCGTGRQTALLGAAYPGAEIVGCDPSPQSLDLAGLATRHLPDVRLCAAPPQDCRFDLIVAAGVVHHIPPRERLGALQALGPLLRTHGRLLIFEHNPLSPLTLFILWRGGNDRLDYLVPGVTMRRLLRQAGFRYPRIEYTSFFPPYMKPLLPLEPYLAAVPCGAQYVASARSALESR